MKKAILIALALGTLVLAGCAFVPPPANQPQVSIVEGKYIVVSPEPLVFTRGKEPVDIEWQLPANSRFNFPTKDGITVDSRQTEKNGPPMRVSKEQFDCELKGNGGKSYRCRNFRVPGIYRYTVRVNDGDTPLKPLDPMIANEP